MPKSRIAVLSVSSEADGKYLDNLAVAVGMIALLEEVSESNPIKKWYRRRSSGLGQYCYAERGR